MIQSNEDAANAGEELDEDDASFDFSSACVDESPFCIEPNNHVFEVADVLGYEVEAEVDRAVIGDDLGDHFRAIAHYVVEASQGVSRFGRCFHLVV